MRTDKDFMSLVSQSLARVIDQIRGFQSEKGRMIVLVEEREPNRFVVDFILEADFKARTHVGVAKIKDYAHAERLLESYDQATQLVVVAISRDGISMIATVKLTNTSSHEQT